MDVSIQLSKISPAMFSFEQASLDGKQTTSNYSKLRVCVRACKCSCAWCVWFVCAVAVRVRVRVCANSTNIIDTYRPPTQSQKPNMFFVSIPFGQGKRGGSSGFHVVSKRPEDNQTKVLVVFVFVFF